MNNDQNIPPELVIPSNYCKLCPTAQGIRYGHDPESYQILTNEAYFRHLHDDEEFANLHCPWKNANCVVYPVEVKWARSCFDMGITPPVKLHPSFETQPQ